MPAVTAGQSRQVKVCKVFVAGDLGEIVGGTPEPGDLASTYILNKSLTL